MLLPRIKHAAGFGGLTHLVRQSISQSGGESRSYWLVRQSLSQSRSHCTKWTTVPVAWAGIGFMTFFLKAAPYVLMTTAITLWMGAKLFKIQRLAADEREAAMAQVAVFDENDGIESDGFFRFAAIMLILFILFIAGASFDGWAVGQLGMGFVAMSFGVLMLIRYKSDADTFYSFSDDCAINVWHFSEKAPTSVIDGKHTAAINDLCFSRDASTFLTCDEDQHMLMWDANTMEPTAHSDAGTIIDKAAFSTDNSMVALSRDGDVLIFEQSEEVRQN